MLNKIASRGQDARMLLFSYLCNVDVVKHKFEYTFNHGDIVNVSTVLKTLNFKCCVIDQFEVPFLMVEF